MENTQLPILHNNPLKHIPELRVDPELLSVRFTSGCSMGKCSSVCCRGGVWADLGERQAILNHVDIVHKYMEPHQEHDPTKWFEEEIVEDADFPSGHAVGTQVVGKGCVFLNGAGL